MHPVKKHATRINEFTDYAAAMNVILVYHKLVDDKKDDNSKSAQFFEKRLSEQYKNASEKYPEKNGKIIKLLDELEIIEKNDIHNPDIPANVFGKIMAEIFDVNNNDEKLQKFGFYLGKVIYVADACNDLKNDIKKCRYNPMVETSSENFQQILTILLADCTNIYDTMNIVKNKNIIDNILYSGIWCKYKEKNK